MDKHPRKKRLPKILLTIVIAVALVGAGWYGWQWQRSRATDEASTQQSQNAQQEDEESRKPIEQRFVQRYYEVDFSGAERITEPPEIVGNKAADRHIQKRAEDRGYRLQYTPTGSLKEINGEKLQPQALKAWKKLKQAAGEEGIYLDLVSGHRSIQTQRIIFDSQLRKRAKEKQGSPYTAQQIAGGKADAVIDEILREYSIPGYSKHHSGYTIDISDSASSKSFEEFGQTEAFQWLSKKDYAKARQYGFLPSYPEGVKDLGPQAELWEYVWVGKDNTKFQQD
jgi:LAS superfamily LD-carboxypeptidase LdcB